MLEDSFIPIELIRVATTIIILVNEDSSISKHLV